MTQRRERELDKMRRGRRRAVKNLRRRIIGRRRVIRDRDKYLELGHNGDLLGRRRYWWSVFEVFKKRDPGCSIAGR